jgi:hypothetical protein
MSYHLGEPGRHSYTVDDPLPAPGRPRTAGAVVGVVIIGALVSVALGVYGNVHNPTGIAVSIAGFSSPQTVKVWLATAAMLLALVQIVTAMALYGKLPALSQLSGLDSVHRWSGRIAFLLTVPVAVHCLYAFGFSGFDTRTLAHSVFGCAFFGVFTAKMLVLTKRGIAGWVLPAAGGLVFAVLAGAWATSALWFFQTSGIHR